MCIECISRICCGNVNLSQEEIRLTFQYNEITQKFLAKRKTILGFLFIWLSIGIIYDIYLLTAEISNMEELSHEIDDYTINVVIKIYEGLLGYLFAYDVITLMFVFVMYYFWNNYRINSKLSLALWIILNTMPIILLYILIKTVINQYIDPSLLSFALIIILIAEIFYVAVSMLIPALSMLQILLLKTNSLFREFEKTYEYRIISTVLTMIYIPIYLVAISVLFQITNDYLIYYFIVTYTLFLIIPTITSNDYAIYISRIFGLASIIILGSILYADFGYNIYQVFISGYVRSLLVDLLITDFINITIMNNKSAEIDSKFNILMKDFGYYIEEEHKLTNVEISDN